jgi:hypothetical protein
MSDIPVRFYRNLLIGVEQRAREEYPALFKGVISPPPWHAGENACSTTVHQQFTATAFGLPRGCYCNDKMSL